MSTSNSRGDIHPPSSLSSNPVFDFIASLPPVTRVLFVATISTTVIANFFLPITHFILIWPRVTGKLELWRLLSSFFVGKLGFNWAMGLYFLYRNSNDLELGKFAGRSADFAFTVILIMLGSLTTSYLFNLLVLTEPLMIALVYLWSNHSPHTPVRFMFGMTFQSMYLPWVLAAWDLLITGSFPYDKFIGIVIGHFVHWVTDLYPASHNGQQLISTPIWLQRAIPQTNGPTSTPHGFGVQPPRSTGTTQGFTAPYWRGSGRRLGD